jgi:hypothetical protein
MKRIMILAVALCCAIGAPAQPTPREHEIICRSLKPHFGGRVHVYALAKKEGGRSNDQIAVEDRRMISSIEHAGLIAAVRRKLMDRVAGMPEDSASMKVYAQQLGYLTCLDTRAYH